MHHYVARGIILACYAVDGFEILEGLSGIAESHYQNNCDNDESVQFSYDMLLYLIISLRPFFMV